MNAMIRKRSVDPILLALALAGVVGTLLSCNQDETAFGPQDAKFFESTIEGRVTDRQGRVLSGALVTALPGGVTTVSGPDGSFTLSGLASGSYQIALAKDDYRDTMWLDSARVGLSVVKDMGKLAMRYRFATVSGVVEDSSGEVQPMAGVAVEDQTPTAMAVSGGKFTLAKVEPGRVRLFSAIQGVGYGTLDTTLDADDTLKGVRLRINRRGGAVTGQIVGTDGNGISGAQVTTVGGALKTTTESDGSFRITEVPGEGKVVVEVSKGALSTTVTGVRVAEGAQTDLSKITIAAIASTGAVAVRMGLAMAFTTDSVVTLVADTISSDSSFRVLRYLWSLDDGATWDTTSVNTWAIRPKSLGWVAGAHAVLVKAVAMDRRVSDAGTITVRIVDATPPVVSLASPKNDTTYAWMDSVVNVSWTVSDDSKLDSVWIDGKIAFPGSGTYSRQLVLSLGRRSYGLKARDSAGNIKLDSVVLTRLAPDTATLTVKRATVLKDTTYKRFNDSMVTVAWVLGNVGRLDSAWIDGKPALVDSGTVSTTLSLPLDGTTVRLRVRDLFSSREYLDSIVLVRLALDTTAPIVELLSPSQNTTYAFNDSLVALTWMVSDVGGIDSAWVNDVAVPVSAGVGVAMLPLDVGKTILRLRVRDLSGNEQIDSLVLVRLAASSTRTDTTSTSSDLDMESGNVGGMPTGTTYGIGGYSDSAVFPWSDGSYNGDVAVGISDSAHLNGVRSLRIFLSNAGGSGGNSFQKTGINMHPDTGYMWTPSSDTISYWMTDVDYTASSRWAWAQGLAAITSKGPVMFWNRCATWGSQEHCAGIGEHPGSDYGFDDATDSVDGSDGRKWRLYRVILPDSLKGGVVKEVLFHAHQASWDGTQAQNRFFLDRIQGLQRSARIAADSASLVVILPRSGMDTLWVLDTIKASSNGAIEYAIDDGSWNTYPSTGVVLTQACSLSVRATESGKIAKAWGKHFDFTTWNPNASYGSLLDDRDGETYRTVTIGSRNWMAENLKFRGLGADTGWLYGDNADSGAKYGRLYTWSAAMGGASSSASNPSGVQGVCPAGWHVPSDEEWHDLITTVDSSISGRVLKSPNGWDAGNDGDDRLGFRILPGGNRSTDAGYVNKGAYGAFWTATQIDASNALLRSFSSNAIAVGRGNGSEKTSGLGLRCLENPPDATPPTFELKEPTSRDSAYSSNETMVYAKWVVKDETALGIVTINDSVVAPLDGGYVGRYIALADTTGIVILDVADAAGNHAYDTLHLSRELARNGSFSTPVSSGDWSMYVATGDSAVFATDSGWASIAISAAAADTTRYSIQLSQSGLSLVAGAAYRVAFDAWSSGSRDIQVALTENSTWQYLGGGSVVLSDSVQRFHVDFTAVTTSSGGVVQFQFGGSTMPVKIDNVSFFMLR